MHFFLVCNSHKHSHWDQLWGLLSRRLSRSSSMVDTDSVVSILKDELQKPSMRAFVNGKVIVDVLRVYRDWRNHVLQKSPVHSDACVNFHWFMFGYFWFWGLFHWGLFLVSTTKCFLIKMVLHFSEFRSHQEGGLLLDRTANHFFSSCCAKARCSYFLFEKMKQVILKFQDYVLHLQGQFLPWQIYHQTTSWTKQGEQTVPKTPWTFLCSWKNTSPLKH